MLLQVNKPMSIGKITNKLLPALGHETIVLFLTMVLESAIEIPTEAEEVILNRNKESTTSFVIF